MSQDEQEMRPGIVVEPVRRLDESRVETLHRGSLSLLEDPGILCFNEEAVSMFDKAGCSTDRSSRDRAWIVRIPEKVVMEAVRSAPSRVVLGARDPKNTLVLDAEVPRVYFGTGSETNVFLETELEPFASEKDPGATARLATHRRERGSLRHLCRSAQLCDRLENVDFFIRNVNVQDAGITDTNKDINVFFASVMHTAKHVQAGLSNPDGLDDLIRLGELVSGSSEAFRRRPVFSFIACLVKSPLQMVDDTTRKVIEIARRGLPIVVSSSPQGGSTAPIQEEGMVSMINAEILAGITLAQLTNPGTPVLYGAVPVRARLDTLHDLYGAPEFVHYNVDCVQMARFYRIPCYSTAGVGDTSVPGLRATIEKLPAHLAVAQSGAQYIHYAFGLLERTNVFSPVQAVLDDANITKVKHILRRPGFGPDDTKAAVQEIRKVMASSTRLFARHIRKHMRRGVVSEPYPLEGEGDNDKVLQNACLRAQELTVDGSNRLDGNLVQAAFAAGFDLLERETYQLRGA